MKAKPNYGCLSCSIHQRVLHLNMHDFIMIHSHESCICILHKIILTYFLAVSRCTYAMQSLVRSMLCINNVSQLCRQWVAMICKKLTTGVIGGLHTVNLRRQRTSYGKAFAFAIGARCERRLRHPSQGGTFCRRKV